MRVVLIEDDEKIGSFVSQGLKQEGHVVSWMRNGDEGLSVLLHNKSGENAVDVAIIDVMLPGKDGIAITRAVRAAKLGTPIIILSARADVNDRVLGLEVGADDYLTKPFSFAELLARLSALTRRASATSSSMVTTTVDRLEVADLTLSLTSRRVHRGGKLIDLQGKELLLLEFLMRNAGRVVSKTMILEHVWDFAFDPQTNVVDVLVSRLRAKIDRDFPQKLLHTIRGVGYVLRGD